MSSLCWKTCRSLNKSLGPQRQTGIVTTSLVALPPPPPPPPQRVPAAVAGTHNTKLNIFDKIQPKFHKRFYTYCFLQARLKSQYLHTVNTKHGEQVRLGPSKSGFQIYFSPAFFRETFQWWFIAACMLRSIQAETTRGHWFTGENWKTILRTLFQHPVSTASSQFKNGNNNSTFLKLLISKQKVITIPV